MYIFCIAIENIYTNNNIYYNIIIYCPMGINHRKCIIYYFEALNKKFKPIYLINYHIKEKQKVS